MLTSISLILLLGLFAGWIFSKIKLPSLLGMIFVGIILFPTLTFQLAIVLLEMLNMHLDVVLINGHGSSSSPCSWQSATRA